MDASERHAAKKRLFRLRMLGIAISAVIMFVMSVQAVIAIEGFTLRGIALFAGVFTVVGLSLAIVFASQVGIGWWVDESRGLNKPSGSDEDPE